MLKNKTILVGISGGIAAYKMLDLVNNLVKQGANVKVIMTKNACNFINPISFEILSRNKCYIDTFDENIQYKAWHIELAKQADILLIAPATANIIAKLANAIADDFLSTLALACDCKKIIAPAMNTRMYENPIVCDNIKKLKKYDFDIMDTESGYLACGDIGWGKLAKIEDIYDRICYHLTSKKDLLNKNILVSAGATKESIDPVRFITNHSSGKMGIEIAKAAYYRGAKVKLVIGESFINTPKYIERINVTSAKQMYEKIKDIYQDMDIIIKAAAVSDYTPKFTREEKIKKSDKILNLELEKTVDILKYLGEHKKDKQILCGFSMETSNLIENSKIKLEKKNLDMIVANNLNVEGAGFKIDTNVASIITKDKKIDCELQSKESLAHKILDEIIKISK